MRRWFQRGLESCLDILSPGGWIICAVAVATSLTLLLWPIPNKEGLKFWIFAKSHQRMYTPMTAVWNTAQPQEHRVHLLLLSGGALQRRLLSGFLAGTPLPSLVEAYALIVAQAFKGPLEDVGFVDLTDLLHQEGIYAQINTPSFGPWTSRGRIFGLPHDVHPVLLAYRADIVEAAGIDVSAIETWDDFVRLLGPLVRDNDGDGMIDRYLLNVWETNPELIEIPHATGWWRLLRRAGTPGDAFRDQCARAGHGRLMDYGSQTDRRECAGIRCGRQ